jgi:uncharacterized membrane protein
MAYYNGFITIHGILQWTYYYSWHTTMDLLLFMAYYNGLITIHGILQWTYYYSWHTTMDLLHNTGFGGKSFVHLL